MMFNWRPITIVAAALAAFGWPAVATANGEHVSLGAVHFDPVIGGGVAIFLGLITLMFVGQWVRFNAARRRAAGSDTSRQLARRSEEATNGSGQEDDGG